jgi:hypothetical protein
MANMDHAILVTLHSIHKLLHHWKLIHKQMVLTDNNQM